MTTTHAVVFRRLIFLCSCFAAGQSVAQPLITPKGIVNAASLFTPGLPSGSIARGSLFTLFGARLGPATGVSASAYPLATNLAGVSIKITQGTVSVDAIPVFAVASQINAIMPSNAPLGAASVVVSFNNNPGPPSPVQVVNSSAGIFAINSAGMGPGVFQNFVAADNQPVNSAAIAATPGQAITLWATGLGPVSYADTAPPSAGDLATAVEIFVGGKAARKLYGGRAPCCAGTDQIVFEIPMDAPLGCWVPVQVRTEGRVVSNTVTLAISSDGSACSEPGNALAKPLVAGGKTGLVSLFRFDQQHRRGRAPIDDILDFASVSFRQESGGQFAFNPLFSLPPAGSCTVYQGSLDFFAGDNPLLTAPTGKYMNGGATFSLISSKGARTIAGPKVGPVNITTIGTSFTYPGYTTRSTPVLDGGNFQLNGDGGTDVGQIRATFPIASALVWTNKDQVASVDRTQPLSVNWTGAATGQTVLVIGSSADIPTNAKAMFVCTAQAAAGTLAIPSQILQSLPVSRTALTKSRASLYVGTVPLAAPSTFTATGLDLGVVMPVLLTGKDLSFREAPYEKENPTKNTCSWPGGRPAGPQCLRRRHGPFGKRLVD